MARRSAGVLAIPDSTASHVVRAALRGKRFRIGDVECEGVELCEPCAHLESMTQPGMIKAFVHRGGLNADILTDGEITVGDPVTVV